MRGGHTEESVHLQLDTIAYEAALAALAAVAQPSLVDFLR
jgi:hypothetical protein